jgi:hypothetical protein
MNGMTVSEVAVPSSQGAVQLGDDLLEAPSLRAAAQRFELLPQLLKAFLPRPFLGPTKVPPQEIDAFVDDVDDPRLGRMQR